jgi:adenylate cyclase
MYGELHPRGGGDTIPLMKKFLVVGRRESCDIVLRWTNVSGAHCELSLVDGFWYVKDLASSNGTKVNGTRVAERRLDPGDTLSIARHEFEIVYEPVRLGATGAPVDDNADRDPLSRSLLEAAGLERRRSRDDSRPPR